MAGKRTVSDRVASALERMADKMDEADRVSELEHLLVKFVTVMQNPQSSDQEWNNLLSHVKQALGIQ